MYENIFLFLVSTNTNNPPSPPWGFFGCWKFVYDYGNRNKKRKCLYILENTTKVYIFYLFISLFEEYFVTHFAYKKFLSIYTFYFVSVVSYTLSFCCCVYVINNKYEIPHLKTKVFCF